MIQLKLLYGIFYLGGAFKTIVNNTKIIQNIFVQIIYFNKKKRKKKH